MRGFPEKPCVPISYWVGVWDILDEAVVEIGEGGRVVLINVVDVDDESRVESNVDEAYTLIDSLKDPDINIDINTVMDELLTDGIEKFVKPFESLMNSLEDKIKLLSPV